MINYLIVCQKQPLYRIRTTACRFILASAAALFSVTSTLPLNRIPLPLESPIARIENAPSSKKQVFLLNEIGIVRLNRG